MASPVVMVTPKVSEKKKRANIFFPFLCVAEPNLYRIYSKETKATISHTDIRQPQTSAENPLLCGGGVWSL
jgi:hypothetical protein